jgi:hypothetical protein
MRKAAASLVAAVLSAGLLTGCLFGGDDAEVVPLPTETTPQALNKDEFIDQADQICEEGNLALAALTGAGSTLISQQVDIHEGVLQQMRGLGDVTEDQKFLDDFYQAYDELVSALKRQQLAAERGDAIGGEAASTSVDGATFRLKMASDEFGFEACGQGAGATDSDTDTGAAPSAPSYTPPSYTPPPSGGGGGGGGGGGVPAP